MKRVENKISVSFSLDTFAFINYDINRFSNGKSIGFGTFINNVFTNYYEDSYASIGIILEAKEALYKSLKLEENAINKLLDYDREFFINLNHKSNSPDTITRKIRMNNTNDSILDTNTDKNNPGYNSNLAYYNNKAGKYVTAVINSYFKLSSCERELIFFKDLIEAFNIAKNRNDTFVITVNDIKTYLKPYKIIKGTTNDNNYLVGLIKNNSDSIIESFRIKAYRLSEIQSYRMNKGGGHISKENCRKIDKEIYDAKGPEFYSTEGRNTEAKKLYDYAINLFKIIKYNDHDKESEENS